MSGSAPSALQAAVRKLAHGESLSRGEAAGAFGIVMSGDATVAQTAALLMGLRVKGETPAEVAGAASAMRAAMTALEVPRPDMLVDTCGTGGGAVTTFNISTAAAFVAAGAGVRVAKHGNRSFTTKCGSADVLEALGISIDVPLAHMREVLDAAGIVFMFAPTMHPAMRHVGPVRREIVIPTVMNLVGPLANPAHAGRQVIGVADPGRVALMAGALQELGTIHSMVVHGAPGMDEVSPLGPTTVLEVRGAEMHQWTLDPVQYGFTNIDAADLAGSEPAENAGLIERILEGGGPRGAQAAVLLNAAAAIHVSGCVNGGAGGEPTYEAALDVARRTIANGAGRAALERLRAAAPRG